MDYDKILNLEADKFLEQASKLTSGEVQALMQCIMSRMRNAQYNSSERIQYSKQLNMLATPTEARSDTRPTWDEYFMNMAKVVSTRATCLRAKHGCVLVKDKRIISTGYNGSPPGVKHCVDDGCILINNHCERCNHAEVNAICNAAKHGNSTQGTVAYITGEPCLECIRTLICAGVNKIYYKIGGHYEFPVEEQQLRDLFINQSGISIEGV